MRDLVFQHYPLRPDRQPPGWAITTLREICSEIQPGFPSGDHNADGVGIPHLRPMNVDRCGRLDLTTVKFVARESSSARVLRGDVLFNNTNSPELVGKTCCVTREGEFAYSNHMTRLRPLQGVEPAFLAHQLHFLWMVGYFRHRCINHVNQASISSGPLADTVPITLAPSAEQRRIVEALDTQFTRFDAAVATLERVRSNLRRYRAAVLQAAIEGRIGGRTTGPSADRLPPGWTWTTIQELGPKDRPAAYGVLQPGSEVLGGVPLVRVMDIGEGRVDVAGLKKIAPAIAGRYPRTRLRGGEVLLSIVGTIGRTAIVSPALVGANTARAIAVIPIRADVDPRWVELALRAPRTVAELTRASHEVARKTLNLEDVRKSRIPLPPSDEQGSIVLEVERLLSGAAHGDGLLASSVLRIQRLRQALLRVAFEGRIIAQDPHDESASALLERICAKRAAIAPSSKRKPTRARP